MFKVAGSFLIVAVLLGACSSSNNQNLQIDFSTDSSKIVFSQIEAAGLSQLKRNLSTDSNYQGLVSVLQTPAEDDSTGMEVEWPGKLQMQGEAVIFIPDTPFVKGKSYLVETILNSRFASKQEIMRAEVGHRLKKAQKFLRR